MDFEEWRISYIYLSIRMQESIPVGCVRGSLVGFVGGFLKVVFTIQESIPVGCVRDSLVGEGVVLLLGPDPPFLGSDPPEVAWKLTGSDITPLEGIGDQTGSDIIAPVDRMIDIRKNIIFSQLRFLCGNNGFAKVKTP